MLDECAKEIVVLLMDNYSRHVMSSTMMVCLLTEERVCIATVANSVA
jgi:hypothetical protein